MSEKPKRRWYQFSLRTLLIFMTFIGVATPVWWNHRCYCENQAARHELDALGGSFISLTMASHKYMAARSSRAEKLAVEYRRAVWQPWLRLWIEDEEAP